MLGELWSEIVRTFVAMAPYLLLGLTFAGILHVMFSKSIIVRHLGGGTFASTVKAALLGVPLPLCSCGVLPTAVSLRKSRASEGATMSFLISTPQTGIDSIVATYGMLGPVFAVFRPVAAFVMGIVGGVLTNLFGAERAGKARPEDSGAQCPMCYETAPHTHGIGEKLSSMVRYAYGSFLDDIATHLVVGIVVSGVIAFVVPEGFFSRYMGNTFLEMLLMIVGGIPLYVCATASIPIAMALMMKGLSPGAAFVFLAVGPATNAAAMTLIGNTMGKRFVAIYIGTIAVLSVAAGYALNGVFAVYGEGLQHIHEHEHMAAGFNWSILFSIVFLAMLVLSLYRKYVAVHVERLRARTRAVPAAEEQTTVLYINGMTCNHCANNVTESLLKVDGVTDAHVDLASKSATVEGTFDIAEARKAIAGAGYTVAD
ncbi:MAG: SO_0444 family Cu/Zn efflux transporter [Chitinivibrionales bacterium]|nr:SO_0444 family Cu/Zn efflux transporter [Chitinivibrionales bacterium]MBD3395433.1 SO_0444 family Cu/Zn efflux transporter [Chitinivibrionales bacterium]